MLTVLRNTWALLLGLGLLMLGNGMQGTLLGIRGGIEEFTTFQMSLVMSAYFVGFLFGSRLAPEMIRRVGHVRVFAALGSMISAVLILYAAAPDWMAWAALRVLIGFSFSGVYIATESWLNNASTNENRGQALSLYLIVQMIGIIAAQLLLNVGDPSGYILFVIPSVLVSLAFTPILLSASPAPAFESTKPMSFRRLYEASPLGCVGMFLLGGVFSAQFGMAAVWGTQAGLSIADLTIFVSAIYVGGLVLQYPIGWLSDRIDRRIVVLWLAVLGAVVLMIPVIFDPPFWVLVGVGAVCGGVSNPLYSLLLAYVNDYLDKTDMAAASAGLMFINGLGAISGPVITGWMMGAIGSSGFFLFMGILFAVLALYAGWRMTQRRETPQVTSGYTPVSPTASIVAVETAAMVEAEDAQQSKARN
ncbi:MFS transporter [Pseudotabrizicola sediminis]|uniref:MFS transporter n=1 Tax=Pseudotabrizicola sediminis TaxID=2486418 RepID=A0ABY2KVL1_9RHOB|nr:MFS transporter [Pseudotabrizicola sediminis]TGD45209.1 MFS transporter [Pseudotabrizicola sediminis]TGD62829.1 MFS transporter [Tabrizicola sp. WMC-M-20]